MCACEASLCHCVASFCDCEAASCCCDASMCNCGASFRNCEESSCVEDHALRAEDDALQNDNTAYCLDNEAWRGEGSVLRVAHGSLRAADKPLWVASAALPGGCGAIVLPMRHCAMATVRCDMTEPRFTLQCRHRDVACGRCAERGWPSSVARRQLRIQCAPNEVDRKFTTAAQAARSAADPACRHPPRGYPACASPAPPA